MINATGSTFTVPAIAGVSSPTNPLGYVVLARRPNPYKQDPWDYEIVSAVFNTVEGVTDALKYAKAYAGEQEELSGVMGVEYVIGEVGAVSMEKPPWPDLT